MKNEMTLGYAHIDSTNERDIIEMIVNAVRIPRQWLRKYYSAILGRNISNRQASLITRCQLAFVGVVLLAPQSPALGIAAAAILALSLKKCKKEVF